MASNRTVNTLHYILYVKKYCIKNYRIENEIAFSSKLIVNSQFSRYLLYYFSGWTIDNWSHSVWYSQRSRSLVISYFNLFCNFIFIPSFISIDENRIKKQTEAPKIRENIHIYKSLIQIRIPVFIQSDIQNAFCSFTEIDQNICQRFKL